ncbi:hypothetical protein MRX96_025029 [Rhipicephalus microplus]
MPVLTAFHLPASLQLLLVELEQGAAEEAQLDVTIRDVCGRAQKHTLFERCLLIFYCSSDAREECDLPASRSFLRLALRTSFVA